MTTIIDIKATLEGTNGRITPRFLASSLARGEDTIKNWIDGGKIPETAMPRLLEVLKNNDVKIINKS